MERAEEDVFARAYRYLVEKTLEHAGLTAEITIVKKTKEEMERERQ